MTYCRVTIYMDTRGCVYKKDFEALHLFSPLVRTYVSDLITQGLVQEGDHYNATIVPRYESQLIANPIVQIDQVRANEPRPWLTLDDGARPDDPLTFFTLELRFKESGLIYTRDFQILSLDYFWQNLQAALLRMHVLADGDRYQPRIYVRHDDLADFSREEVHMLQDENDDPLIELIAVEDPETDFTTRSLSDFDIIRVEKNEGLTAVDLDEQNDLHIVIRADTLDALQQIARAQADIEQGGVLVGQAYRCGEGGYLVDITDYIVAEGASASQVELRYTFESWQQQSAQLRARFPGKQIVGWYHTHLITMEVQSSEASYSTGLFFSADDLFVHRQFFSDRWYVAMVLTQQGHTAFFRWFGDEIGASRRYHVYQPV